MFTRKSLVPALAAVVTLLLLPATSAAEDGVKKGVSVNDVAGVDEALGDVGASWFYDWSVDEQGVTPPEGTEFVPMIWGAESVNQQDLDEAKASGSTLLAFNEPDMTEQANLTVEQALDLWPQLQDTGMRLSAPGVATGADLEGGWLDRFMRGADERGYRVDFIPLHWYGADFSPEATEQLRGYVEAVHERYRKPVWLTEYALIDFSGGTPRYPGEQEQADFVRSSTAMLEGLPFVERYSWFTLSTETSPTGLYDGAQPNTSGTAYRDAAAR
ncbi:glycoside hydrolase family protein [Saccharopolyspora gloriosae]|uniref:glycoside hydrolase family protein n=1 Tax=Saccharopolyspora gloriosae TaxID=455344 RepID=UPI001FB6E9FA|nr:glycoside hydrolase family protein [Saccharopolyspora gloriosae]